MPRVFERYTEKARRVVFFARYEAFQFGSQYIQPEHVLLGILREDKLLARKIFSSHAQIEALRKRIERESGVHEKTSTTVDLPLSHPAKRVLVHAKDEADRLRSAHIDTGHLILGILREETTLAARLLSERAITLESFRAEVGMPPGNDPA